MISGLPYLARVTTAATSVPAAAASSTFIAVRPMAKVLMGDGGGDVGAAPVGVAAVVVTPIVAPAPGDDVGTTDGSSVAASTYGTHPASISMTPTDAIGALWPGMKLDEPSRLYFPVRAPSS